MGFEVQGIDKLMSALTALSNPNFADQALMKGLMLAGKQIQGTAKKLCSVDTGQLRNSIEVTEVSDGVDVGTNVEYAPYVEYGTGAEGDGDVPHTTKEVWRYVDEDGNWHTTSGQPPRPFLYPALKANEGNVGLIVNNTLQQEIDKVVG